MEQLAALRADITRTGQEPSLRGGAVALWRSRPLRAIACLRANQALDEHPAAATVLKPLTRLALRRATHSAGIELSWQTTVGKGLTITHGYGTVINPATVIGNNVTIFQGVTLGQRDRIGRDGERTKTGAPVIEDEVWIGPNAVIVGPVRIGRGSRIAAGAFVTEDVPPHSLVGGNPAKILKGDVAPDVSHPAPDVD